MSIYGHLVALEREQRLEGGEHLEKKKDQVNLYVYIYMYIYHIYVII